MKVFGALQNKVGMVLTVKKERTDMGGNVSGNEGDVKGECGGSQTEAVASDASFHIMSITGIFNSTHLPMKITIFTQFLIAFIWFG